MIRKTLPDPGRRAPVSGRLPDPGQFNVGLGVGRKYDVNKPRWCLLPWRATAGVVEVLTHGAEKYGDHNWRALVQTPDGRDRLLSAVMRHIVAHARGQRRDGESSLPHLAHAACGLLMLLEEETRSRRGGRRV